MLLIKWSCFVYNFNNFGVKNLVLFYDRLSYKNEIFFKIYIFKINKIF